MTITLTTVVIVGVINLVVGIVLGTFVAGMIHFIAIRLGRERIVSGVADRLIKIVREQLESGDSIEEALWNARRIFLEGAKRESAEVDAVYEKERKRRGN